MLTFFSIIFVFGVLVIIHELGHFLAAKWMGVRVEKFSIGFPPTIFTKKIGETNFSIGAIPLGGFVKMSGFVDESMDDNITGAEYEFNSKPIWRRIVIISGGVIMNLILAVIILAYLNFSQGEQILPYTTVGVVGENGIAQKIGFQIDDKILSINGVPVHSWNEVQEQFVNNLNSDITFKILRNGKEKILTYKKEWFSDEKGEYLDIDPLIPAKVGMVQSDMPASKLGLQKADEIVSLDGHTIKRWQEMTEIIRSHPGQEISIAWIRGQDTLKGLIVPDIVEEKTAKDSVVAIGKIGIGYYYDHKQVGAGRAFVAGIENTYNLILLNAKGLWWVISGVKSAKEVVGGPIMIAKMAGEAAAAGWAQLLYLIAALSAILAFFNILPIPALDGGHLVFLIIEAIIGRPIPLKVKIKVQQIGMAILLALIIFIFYVDIKRLLL